MSSQAKPYGLSVLGSSDSLPRTEAPEAPVLARQGRAAFHSSLAEQPGRDPGNRTERNQGNGYESVPEDWKEKNLRVEKPPALGLPRSKVSSFLCFQTSSPCAPKTRAGLEGRAGK